MRLESTYSMSTIEMAYARKYLKLIYKRSKNLKIQEQKKMFTTICIALLLSQAICMPIIENVSEGTYLTKGQDWEIESGLILAPTAQQNNVIVTVLPLGDGDSTIIQCPDGEVIVLDMGKDSSSGGWTIAMVQSYLRNIVHRVSTVVISHASQPHYNFINTVLDHSLSKSLQRIILAGYSQDYVDTDFKFWVNQRSDIVEYVNYQKPCISDCFTDPPMCKNVSGKVQFKYLGANLGNNKYGRSAVLYLKTAFSSMLFPGDFEGLDIESLLVDEWSRVGANITATHMKLSRHGSQAYSNSDILINAIQPRIAFSSNAYPVSPFFTPSCGVIDRLLRAGSILKRTHSMAYACGDEDNGTVKQYQNWPYEIYTTSPSKYQWQLLTFKLPI